MSYVAWCISFLASAGGLVFAALNLLAFLLKQGAPADPPGVVLAGVVSALVFAVSWDQMKARWG